MATIMYEGLPIAPGRRHLVEPGREVQGHVMFSAPDRARAEEAGSGVPDQAMTSQPARAVPGRRAAGRADRHLDRRRLQAHHRQLLADRDRLLILTLSATASKAAPTKFGSKGGLRLRRQTDRRDHRRGDQGAEPEGRDRRRRPAAAGLPADRLAATTSACQAPTGRASNRLVMYSTFDWGSATRTATFILAAPTT